MSNARSGSRTARVGVRSVERALRLLSWVCSEGGPQGISLAHLSRLSELSKPSVYRLMNSLEDSGLVARDSHSGAYVPGSGLLQLAHRGLEKIRIVDIAGPVLDELQSACNETVHLAVHEDGEVVYLDKRETNHTIRMHSAVGRRAPMHCTGLGKAIMAFLPVGICKQILESRPLIQYTERTLTDKQRLLEELSSIRERGYSVDLEEHEEHICCVAAPVFDHTGRVSAAISVTIPSFRVVQSGLGVLGRQVRESALTVSARLGWEEVSECPGGKEASMSFVEQGLTAMGLSIPDAPEPVAQYVRTKQVGELMYVSGQGPIKNGEAVFLGRVGVDLSLEEGYEAARLCALNCLAAVKQEVGDLDNVREVVYLRGFVSSSSDFYRQPEVINGASDLLVHLFGEKGRHARAALGVSTLPGNIPVEVELIVRV